MHPLPSLARAAAQAEAQLRAIFERLNARIETQLEPVFAKLNEHAAGCAAGFTAAIDRAIAPAADSFAALSRGTRDAVRPTLPPGPVTDPSTILMVAQPIIIGVNDAAAQRAIQELLRRPRPPFPGWN